MTEQDVAVLKIYVLFSPLLVVLAGLAAVWLGIWIDRHDRPPHAAE
jgi:hypothetical protein